jgi:hypothetical protein
MAAKKVSALVKVAYLSRRDKTWQADPIRRDEEMASPTQLLQFRRDIVKGTHRTIVNRDTNASAFSTGILANPSD